MQQLNAFYQEFLHRGFIVLRQAIWEGDDERAKVEFELLHNVPSLLNESNLERHRYFWFVERDLYMKWVSAPGREHQKSRMLTYYQSLWDEFEQVFLAAFQRSEDAIART